MTKFNTIVVDALECCFLSKTDELNHYPMEIHFPIEKIGKQVPKFIVAMFCNMYAFDKDLVV